MQRGGRRARSARAARPPSVRKRDSFPFLCMYVSLLRADSLPSISLPKKNLGCSQQRARGGCSHCMSSSVPVHVSHIHTGWMDTYVRPPSSLIE